MTFESLSNERLIALDDGGDRVAVGRVLGPVLAADPSMLVPLLRLRRERLVPQIRGLLPPADWQKAFADAWLPVVMSDPFDAAGTEAFTEDLVDIVPGDDPELAATLELERGKAWMRLGNRQRARADYEAASTHAVVASTRTQALVELATVDVAENAPDAAMAHLAEALALSPTPILAADALVIREDLSPLRGHPSWTPVVVRARRLTE
jgi:hypothetical protein